jgi:hypothetical protein
MNTQKRILNFRNQSRIDLPKVNTLFFNEGLSIDQLLSESTEKSIKNKDVIIFKEDLYCLADLQAKLTVTKKEGQFVVDWQITD